MVRILRPLLPLILIILCSCNDNQYDKTMYFTGDSLVARWDLELYFPTWVTYNNGKSGAKIDYIESQAGKYAGKEVAIEIGTNDTDMLSPDNREQYLQRYINAISGLRANKLYLYSLLPRDFKNDMPEVNKEIREFNLMVQQAVINHPDIVYIDIYNDFLKKGEDSPSPQYYSDGLHLSPYGYEIMANALKHAVED